MTARVEKMFDAIAPTYDALNHVLSFGIDRGWRRRVVRMVAGALPPGPCTGSGLLRHSVPRNDVGADPSLRGADGDEAIHNSEDYPAILDVATGTGDLAVALARRIPGARVTGVDISEGMLEVGRAKVAHRALVGRIELRRGDGEALEFADGTFDAVTVAFGVRNFGDIDAGLREMWRVLRPGGRCWVLEFSEPRGAVFGPVYRFYFHRVLPWLGRLVSREGEAYSYLPRSVDGFPAPERFAAMLRGAGFATVRMRRLSLGIAYVYEAQK